MTYSDFAKQFIGVREGSRKHKQIIDGYNNSIRPLPRNYRVTYHDAWCATFVSYVLYECGAKNAPYECGVYNMLQKAKVNKQIVKTPHVNDLVIYDWGNNGTVDHVGIISNISGSTLTVIEGNKSDQVATRIIDKNNPEIECFIRVPQTTTTNTSVHKPTTTANKTKDVISDTIRGKYGNGYTRINNLTAMGYDYRTVQKLVNEKLKNNDVISDIIRGKYGNGDTRKNKITSLGYEYKTVQRIVNERLMHCSCF